MKGRKVISLWLLLPVVLLLCGFFFDKPTVLVDTDRNRVYEYIRADQILSDFSDNEEGTRDKYIYGCYLVSGKVKSVSNTGDTV
ncbi:MAG: hypothetical protein IJU93_01525, partial [Lachnospiraceae bacterium]|nr:hypothetical protein [Lachnospiraceae bacterium]